VFNFSLKYLKVKEALESNARKLFAKTYRDGYLEREL